jgi:uncharacterized surface protein with fasciclin (FAS1) repeats
MCHKESMNSSDGSAVFLDILDTASANGSLGTFARTIRLAGMEEALRADGPFTVFAPTDAAFDKLPPGKLDSLFEPSNQAELISLLRYHVLAGRRSASDIGHWRAAMTLHGRPAAVRLSGGRISIDGANVTAADIQSSNGIIHTIDKVNMPRATVEQLRRLT